MKRAVDCAPLVFSEWVPQGARAAYRQIIAEPHDVPEQNAAARRLVTNTPMRRVYRHLEAVVYGNDEWLEWVRAAVKVASVDFGALRKVERWHAQATAKLRSALHVAAAAAASLGESAMARTLQEHAGRVSDEPLFRGPLEAGMASRKANPFGDALRYLRAAPFGAILPPARLFDLTATALGHSPLDHLLGDADAENQKRTYAQDYLRVFGGGDSARFITANPLLGGSHGDAYHGSQQT